MTIETATMTESEWLACEDPEPMLGFLRGRASDRKLRLFAVACCRRIWHLMADDRSRTAVEVAERYSDGLATYEQLTDASYDAEVAADSTYFAVFNAAEAEAEASNWPPENWVDGAWECATDAAATARTAASASALDHPDLIEVTGHATRALAHAASPLRFTEDCRPEFGERAAAEDGEQAAQADLLRDIFGNPFRPVSLDPAWLSPSVVALAWTIYEERSFDRMPELADAFEAAGCHGADILDHCRQAGPHVRGCWVVDAILGKE
jgi:hypothetical protein